MPSDTKSSSSTTSTSAISTSTSAIRYDDWESPMRRILEKLLLRRDAAAFRGGNNYSSNSSNSNEGDADDPMVSDIMYIYINAP